MFSLIKVDVIIVYLHNNRNPNTTAHCVKLYLSNMTSSPSKGSMAMVTSRILDVAHSESSNTDDR